MAWQDIFLKSEILAVLMAALHSEVLVVDFRTKMYDSCSPGKDVTCMQSWKGCDLEVIAIDVLLFSFPLLIG